MSISEIPKGFYRRDETGNIWRLEPQGKLVVLEAGVNYFSVGGGGGGGHYRSTKNTEVFACKIGGGGVSGSANSESIT